MKKRSKRVSSHPVLTTSTRAKLREVARQEQQSRHDPEVQHADQQAKLRAFQRRQAALLSERAAQLLLALKQTQNLSYSELEARTGIDRPALNRLLNGKYENPTLETISRVASAMGKQLTFELIDAE